MKGSGSSLQALEHLLRKQLLEEALYRFMPWSSTEPIANIAYGTMPAAPA